MDWDRVEGNWKQVKEQWGKLTDDDLDVIGGKRDQLEGKLQEQYGKTKDDANEMLMSGTIVSRGEVPFYSCTGV